MTARGRARLNLGRFLLPALNLVDALFRLGAYHLPEPEGVLFTVLFRERYEESLGFGTALHLPYSIINVLRGTAPLLLV